MKQYPFLNCTHPVRCFHVASGGGGVRVPRLEDYWSSAYMGPNTKRLELRKGKHGSFHQAAILSTWWWSYRLQHVVWCDLMWRNFKGSSFQKYIVRFVVRRTVEPVTFSDKWRATGPDNIMLWRCYSISIWLLRRSIALCLYSSGSSSSNHHVITSLAVRLFYRYGPRSVTFKNITSIFVII
jgi:hypothetical protein